MGKADEYQFDYLDNNSRFADQVNGALSHGKQVVKPDELKEADPQFVYLGREADRRKEFKAVVDKVRMWQGTLIHILAVENQSYVDYRMVLHQLFEVVRYGNGKEKLKAVIEANKERYSRIDSDTRELLEVVAKVRIKEEIMVNEEKKYDLCKAFVDMKLEGSRERLIKATCIKLQKNKSAEAIAAELEEELPEIERIIEAQRKVGTYNVEQIYEALYSEALN